MLGVTIVTISDLCHKLSIRYVRFNYVKWSGDMLTLKLGTESAECLMHLFAMPVDKRESLVTSMLNHWTVQKVLETGGIREDQMQSYLTFGQGLAFKEIAQRTGFFACYLERLRMTPDWLKDAHRTAVKHLPWAAETGGDIEIELTLLGMPRFIGGTWDYDGKTRIMLDLYHLQSQYNLTTIAAHELVHAYVFGLWRRTHWVSCSPHELDAMLFVLYSEGLARFSALSRPYCRDVKNDFSLIDLCFAEVLLGRAPMPAKLWSETHENVAGSVGAFIFATLHQYLSKDQWDTALHGGPVAVIREYHDHAERCGLPNFSSLNNILKA